MALTKRAIGGIVHDQEGDAVLHAKFEDAHNVGVYESSNGLGFRTKVLQGTAHQTWSENFNSRLCIQVNMLTKVDIGEATLPKQTDELIVAKLLACLVCHLDSLEETSSFTFRPCKKKGVPFFAHPQNSERWTDCFE